ncbi:MAG: hypothetical protein ED557_07100 [Balneola sp.]|nr:MAG: hypothetical protein ED557_07100 [Balneola sp.]
MEFSKYIITIVLAITLFGILGGFESGISMAEMTIRAVLTGLIFAALLVLKEAKTALFNKIS